MLTTDRLSRRRQMAFALVCVFALAVAACGEDETSVSDGVLPDLTMSPPQNFSIEVADNGKHELRFDTVMNNLGSGDFVVAADRDGNDWTLTQRFAMKQGGTASAPVSASMSFGGDGHDHWHIIGAARYSLERLDGELEGDRFDSKVGFCMFDSVPQNRDLPGAPDSITHRKAGCGDEESEALEMGISIGWGDLYTSNIEGQYIDVTGLPEGSYRLLLEVDPDGVFQEEDRTNNTAWADFQLEAPATPNGPLTFALTGLGTSYGDD